MVKSQHTEQVSDVRTCHVNDILKVSPAVSSCVDCNTNDWEVWEGVKSTLEERETL